MVVFCGKPLDGLTKKQKYTIIAPGFSVSNNTYPSFYPLFKDLNRIEAFFPLGCSFQHVSPSESAFLDTPIDKSTDTFLKSFAEKYGAYPCRDKLIVDRLESFDIPAYYMGDLGLFDQEKIGKPAQFPEEISSVVITLQHHVKYIEQAIKLMKLVIKKFPQSRKYVSLHSIPNDMYKILRARAIELGFEILNIYGDTENFQKYADIDLHIGYRLHGHIHFLRNRKPSILFVEDARSFGFSRTRGTAHGCIDAYDLNKSEPDDYAPEKAIEFLNEQIHSGFKKYNTVFDFIDETYRNIVAPHIDLIASKISSDNS